MNAVYGDTGFWAWLRYWYLDSADFVTLMLMDKGYYDYDYEPVKKKPELTAEDKELLTAEKLDALLGVKRINPKPLNPEEIQRAVMADLESRKSKNR